MKDSPPEIQVSTVSALNDRDLLRRFVQDADETAFAEIVYRHQNLVMGVCRRVIGNNPDVDDAFQATFIALARRPRSVRRAVALSSWLYTVAWRTSVRLVRQRRKNPVECLTEAVQKDEPDPLDQIASAQDCLVLDEELSTLPGKYRDVLVMTYFAGQGSQQIADQLNVSKGTIDGRIRQARNMLRVRLARRGVAIGAIAMAVGLSSGTSAAASPVLVESTVQLGTQTLTGSLPGTTDLSHLEPFIQPETAMLSSKLIVPAMLCAAAAVGFVGMAGSGQGEKDQAVAAQNPNIQTKVGALSDEETVGATIVSSEMNADGEDRTRDDVRIRNVAAHRWMVQMMHRPIPQLNFDGTLSVADALEKISEHFTQQYGKDGRFQFAINTDDSALHDSGIRDLALVFPAEIMDLDGMTLQDALKLMLGGKRFPFLTHEVRDNGLFITTNSVLTGLSELEADESRPFQPYSADAALVEKWMHEMLDKTIPPLDFPGEFPLSEVLDTIQAYYTTSYGGTTAEADYRMTIYPDVAELDLEGLTSLEDVTVRNVSFEGISLRNALHLIFQQTTDPELTWEIENEVMKITTVRKANSPENLVARVYNVAKLLELDPAFRATADEAVTATIVAAADDTVAEQKRTGSPRSNLAGAIVEMTPADSWDKSGGAGTIRLVGSRLLVRQTPALHRQVVRLLNLLGQTESGSVKKRLLKSATPLEWPTSVAGCQRPGGNPEQSWVVEFADRVDQQLYFEQLDFLKIQLGCIFDDARVAYLSSLSKSPVLRETNLNDEPRRMFTHWSDAERENADTALFTNVGVSTDDRRAVFHVYDPETKLAMSKLELEYCGNSPGRILRTLFRIRPVNDGFEFYVADQQLR